MTVENIENEEVILQLAVPLSRSTRIKCKMKAASVDSSITAIVRQFLEEWVDTERIEAA